MCETVPRTAETSAVLFAMNDPTSSSPLHRLLRDARRKLGLTQAELARRVSCAQSAVCMMENGRADALSRETLAKIGAVLGVSIPEAVSGAGFGGGERSGGGVAICPNPDCPTILPYRVGGELCLLPRAHVGGGTRCPLCGEVLLRACPECGAPIRAGSAFCVECGAAHVTHAYGADVATDRWLLERQERSRLILAWGAAAGPLDGGLP